MLAFACCTDLHDASGHQGTFICRGAVSSACDTACADQRVPYRKALPELLLEFGRRAHLLLLRAAGPSCYDAHIALLSALALVASTQHTVLTYPHIVPLGIAPARRVVCQERAYVANGWWRSCSARWVLLGRAVPACLRCVWGAGVA